MYCPPGVSSVVLILAKLQIIAFIACLHTALFLSLERPAGYTPVITYSMAKSNNCFSFSFASRESIIVNATQQTLTKQSLQRRLKVHIVHEGGPFNSKGDKILCPVGWSILVDQLSHYKPIAMGMVYSLVAMLEDNLRAYV